MSIILKENSSAIQQNITNSGIEVCACASFLDACWLDYHPGVTTSVHGVGFWGEDPNITSQQEELERFIQECTEPYICKDVDEFITKIKESQKQ